MRQLHAVCFWVFWTQELYKTMVTACCKEATETNLSRPHVAAVSRPWSRHLCWEGGRTECHFPSICEYAHALAHIHEYKCTSACICVNKCNCWLEGNLRCHASVTAHPDFRDRSPSRWDLGLTGWPASPRNPSVSVFLVLRLQVGTPCLAYLCKSWEPF